MRILSTGIIAVAFACNSDAIAEELDAAWLDTERIVSLESTHTVRRNGTVDVDVAFDLIVAGDSVKRGPCLNFLRVYRGPLGLVLDNNIIFEGVWRNGTPENYREELREFETSLFVGNRDRFLKPGNHRYQVKYTIQGDWQKAGSHYMGAFDMVGAFGDLRIEHAVVHLNLPEGVAFERYSSSVTGINEPLPGYETTQLGNQLRVETLGVMEKDRSLFINAVWPAGSFATRSQWTQVLIQHPMLPVTLFVACFLAGLLSFLIIRILANRQTLRDACGAS